MFLQMASTSTSKARQDRQLLVATLIVTVSLIPELVSVDLTCVCQSIWHQMFFVKNGAQLAFLAFCFVSYFLHRWDMEFSMGQVRFRRLVVWRCASSLWNQFQCRDSHHKSVHGRMCNFILQKRNTEANHDQQVYMEDGTCYMAYRMCLLGHTETE